MRGNLRKWCVLGALASAAWVFPGCKSDSRDRDPRAGSELVSEPMLSEPAGEPGTGGSGTVIMEDSEAGVGGSGEMKTTVPDKKPRDAGMPMDAGMSRDSGTGGSGFDPAAVPNTVPHNLR